MRLTLKLLMTVVLLLLIGSMVAVQLYVRHERQKMAEQVDRLLSQADTVSYAIDFDNNFSRPHPIPVTTAPSQPSGSGIFGSSVQPGFSLPDEVAELRSLGPAAVPHLIEVLGRRNTVKCLVALEALAEMNDRRAVPKICELLDDEQEIVRIYAAYALGKIKDPAAVEALVKVADRENELAVMVRNFFTSLRPEPDLSVESDSKQTMMAVWALGEIGDKRAVGTLVSLLFCNHGESAELAGEALVKIGDKSAIQQIIAPHQGSADGRLFLTFIEIKTMLRLGATLKPDEVLGGWGQMQLSESIPTEVRRRVQVRAGGEMQLSERIPTGIGQPRDYELLCECIFLLYKVPSPPQKEGSLTFAEIVAHSWPLEKQSLWVRRPLVYADESEFHKAMKEAVSKFTPKTWDIIYGFREMELSTFNMTNASTTPDTTKVTNHTILQLIQDSGGPDSEEVLRKWMRDEDPDFRIMTIRFMRGRGFLAAIRPFLHDKDSKVREAAFDALLFAGPVFPEMLQLLRNKGQPSPEKWDQYSKSLLAHPDFHVRFLASWMRGTLDNAEERLKDCLTDEEPCVREMAAEALKQLRSPATAP